MRARVQNSRPACLSSAKHLKETRIEVPEAGSNRGGRDECALKPFTRAIPAARQMPLNTGGGS